MAQRHAWPARKIAPGFIRGCLRCTCPNNRISFTERFGTEPLGNQVVVSPPTCVSRVRDGLVTGNALVSRDEPLRADRRQLVKRYVGRTVDTLQGQTLEGWRVTRSELRRDCRGRRTIRRFSVMDKFLSIQRVSRHGRPECVRPEQASGGVTATDA